MLDCQRTAKNLDLFFFITPNFRIRKLKIKSPGFY